MSSRDGNQELDDGDTDDARYAGDVEPAGGKDAVVARIKHNFYLETQAFRKRILDATDEASRARERVDSFQSEMLRVKKKCFKLAKLLQERDATIQFLHEQQAVSFPIMMSETMRSIHAHMDNQQQGDDIRSDASISRMREQAQARAAVDDRIHEYEVQITQLYSEIQDEQQKNEMLSECLREQKHSKSKLMKACKHAKQEIEALKSNGMAQLLDDMQAKCQRLEAANERLSRELLDEQLKVEDARDQNELLARQSELLSEAQRNWDDVVRRKDDELLRLREQIRAQQVLLENMGFDMKNARASLAEQHGESDDDAREEREFLVQALQSERLRLKDAEQEIQELRTKTESLERSLAAQQLRRKVNVLHELLRSYVETDAINIQLLAHTSWREDDELASEPFVSQSLLANEPSESCETRLRRELLHAKRSLSELQQLIEDICATSMGSSCALQ